MQGGGRRQDVLDEPAGVPDWDQLLPLGLRQGAGDLVGEVGRGDEFVDLPPVVVAQPDGLRRQRVWQDPWACGRSVEDVLHVSSSSRNKALSVSLSISP